MSNVFVFRQPPHGVITEYFGGGGKGGSTTVNKVEIPPEVLARYNAVNARAETVAQQPYQAYSQDPNAFVAPLTQTQQAGIQNTNAMAGAAQPYYGAAAGLAAAGTGNVNPETLNVGQYYNPFTQAVAAPTLAALQQQQAVERSSLVNPQTAASFGGDRSGVVAANLARQQALGTAQAMNPIYQTAYNQALQTAQQQQGVGLGAAQANRTNLQQAAQLFGNLGTGAQAAGLAGAQAQMGAGQTEQQTQQAGLQALYNQFQQKQGYPFQVAQFLANIAEGTGALSGNQSTQTTTGGGGFFSDERLKENIQKVGETNDGQPIYRYNYKGDPRTQIGLLAQDVEKHHPEAVGSSQGYKTVDYKKATQDAVHKEGGGALSNQSGLGAYEMDAPSAMLSGPAVGPEEVAKMAVPGLAGAGLRIQPGAINPEAAGLLAPKATGFSPGTLEGKRAEADSLRSSLASGNASGIGSGPGYVQSRLSELDKFLAANSSQGGLVGAGGGNFARGGLAFGGVPEYVNPALQYYAPGKGDMMGAGPYGVAPRQSAQRQLLQGAKIERQPQRNAIDEASKIGQLGTMGSQMWGARPDFMRSDADVARRKLAEQASEARDAQIIERAKGLDVAPKAEARGGLIGDRDHYAAGSYVNPDNNPYGGVGGGYLDETLRYQSQAPQHQMLKGGELQRPAQKPSGLGELTQMASLGKTGKDVYDFAAKKLAGEASPTAMSSTTAEAAPTGLAGGATEAAPAATEAAGIAGAAPETISAGLAGATEAAAPEVLGAGLAGATEAAAPVAMAAGEGIADALPFLFFLKDGGAVPHRHHFATDANVPIVTTPRADPFGADTSVPMTEEEKANALIKQLAQQTIEQQAPTIERRNAATAAPVTAERTPEAKPVPVRPAIGETGPGRSPIKHLTSGLFSDNVSPDTKAALTSENLWVPALAGVGAMLASPNKTLAGAIGSGLVGGTTAYTGLQKQQSETDLARARERAELVGTAKASVEYNKEGFPTAVFVSDGMGGMRRMPFLEAYRNRDKLNLLPDVLSEIEGIAKARPELVREAGAPTVPTTPAAPAAPALPAPGSTTQKAPAAPTGAKPKTTEAAAATEEAAPQQTGAIVTSNEGGDYRYAVEPKKNGAADKYFGSTGAFKGVNLQDPQEVQTIIQSDQNLSERAKNDAKIAEDIRKQIPTINRNMADLHTLSSSINKIGDKGFTQRGAGQEYRTALADLYNTTARVMGIPNMQMIDANSDISATQIINKIQSLSSPEIAKGAGFHAAGIADSIRSAMPGGKLTLEAANTILASMYSEMQKMRDFDKYYDAQTRRYGTGLNAYGNFTNDMAGVYGPEKEAIKKALMAHEVVPKEGDKYRQSYADVVRKDPKSAVQLDKLFKSPGFARYWSDN